MKILLSLIVTVPFVACSAGGVSTNSNAGEADAAAVETPEPEVPAEEEPAPSTDAGAAPKRDAGPTAPSPADTCLNGQDMDAPDVDISLCPPVPEIPAEVIVQGKKVSLGAWELGTIAGGATYKYGTLSAPTSAARTLNYCTDDACTSTTAVAVNAENLACWGKGYYRLRKILQNPPAEWLALRSAGFQFRFFQFQSDLRNGPTGYKQIASFQDHLVKWVTVVQADGSCTQPTLTKFRTYAKSELTRRNLPVPTP